MGADVPITDASAFRLHGQSAPRPTLGTAMPVSLDGVGRIRVLTIIITAPQHGHTMGALGVITSAARPGPEHEKSLTIMEL